MHFFNLKYFRSKSQNKHIARYHINAELMFLFGLKTKKSPKVIEKEKYSL